MLIRKQIPLTPFHGRRELVPVFAANYLPEWYLELFSRLGRSLDWGFFEGGKQLFEGPDVGRIRVDGLGISDGLPQVSNDAMGGCARETAAVSRQKRQLPQVNLGALEVADRLEILV